MILAQLIGEQTLPNLLGALALRPTHVIHIVSDPKRFSAPIRNFEKALALSGLKPDFQQLPLGCAHPAPDQIAAALDSLPPDRRPTTVNVTGGTKLMSLGAQTWARNAAVPAFYVDTAARAFVPTTAVPLPPLPALSDIVLQLDLPRILAAHGVPANQLQGRIPTTAEIDFGRAAAAAWEKNQECAGWIQALRHAWLDAKGIPLPQAWCTNVAAPDNAACALAEAAKAAGWARIDANGKFSPLVPVNQAGDSRLRADFVKGLLQNLEGGWFELHVARRMLESGHFHDLRWSVQSPGRRDLALGENDIVALDRRSLSPVFVSCKSSTAFDRPLEHIFSLRQRATHFGGTFAQAVLCIARLYHEDQKQELQGFCRAASVRLVVGEDALARWLAPATP
jgi:Domain of unknown function (DUF1887).